MFGQGELISYPSMCQAEGTSLQRGMNYRLGSRHTVILMSVRPGAPYADRVEDEGRVLIYEGHDTPKRKGAPDPKTVDQPTHTPGGKLTQNGLFLEAVGRYKRHESEPELVKVYDKIRPGIWVYCDVFELIDAWQETVNSRQVFKFQLKLTDEEAGTQDQK